MKSRASLVYLFRYDIWATNRVRVVLSTLLHLDALKHQNPAFELDSQFLNQLKKMHAYESESSAVLFERHSILGTRQINVSRFRFVVCEAEHAECDSYPSRHAASHREIRPNF